MIARVDSRLVRRAVTHDEIGLAQGRHRGHVLRSVFQPVYRREEEMLVPVAFQALARIASGPRALPVRATLDTGARRERFFLDCLCRAVHVDNLAFLGTESPRACLTFDMESEGRFRAALALVRDDLARLEEEGFGTPRAVLEISPASQIGPDRLAPLVREARAAGFGIAVAHFGPEARAASLVAALAPDHVRVAGAWFRSVARHAEALDLLAALRERLRAAGAELLVEGIETPAQMRAAIDVGAGLFQGFLLSPPVAAGSVEGFGPRAMPKLAGPVSGTIPLRRPA